MNNKEVYVLKVSPDDLRAKVDFLVTRHLRGRFDPEKHTVIKINGNFNYIYPGSNTSPWFLDSLCYSLRNLGFKNIIVAEGDLPAFRAEDMIITTNLIKILEKYSIPFVAYEDYGRDADGIPLLFKDAQIINTPVPHGHGIATISCATKNLFGILSKDRWKYHRTLTNKLLELNDKLKTYIIVDGTVALTGESTRRGEPFRLNLLLSGWSNLHIDVTIAIIMGYEPDEVELLRTARERKLIDFDVALKGDFTIDTLPKYNLRFKHSTIRKVAMTLENTRLEYIKYFRDIENILRKIYHYINYIKKRNKLYSGPWMEYNKDSNGNPYF